MGVAVAPITAEAELPELLPLMRGYLDFYEGSPADDPLLTPETAPSDECLLSLSRTLIADPEREGVQFLARDETGRAVGFATLYWTWSTTRCARVGVMNDLFVVPEGRGTGAAEALIDACQERVRDRGGAYLEWQTAHDNRRAQRVYDRIGGERDTRFISYSR